MKFDDMVEFELNIQMDRLKYIKGTLAGNVVCDYPPRKIYIEPTNICNLKCVHCVHDGALTRKPGYFDYDLYTRMIDDIADLAMHTKVQFTGVGEPFFHKRIFDMIKYASDRGFFTLMNSNATILDREKCERLVDSGLDYLHVSLDGVTKKTYEAIRVGADFDKVIENIFTLFEVRQEKHGDHLAVILGIVDQKRNRDEVEQFLRYFEQYPFHHVVAGELFNHMGTVEEASLNYADRAQAPIETYPVCNTPWDLLSFNCDGQAVACNYDFDNRYVIGDAHDEGVLDIWNSQRMQDFRANLLKRDYAPLEKNGPLCSECTIKWQKDYHLPCGFHSEVARMEEYLTRAIYRCAHHKERNAELRRKEADFLGRKDALIRELKALEGR